MKLRIVFLLTCLQIGNSALPAEGKIKINAGGKNVNEHGDPATSDATPDITIEQKGSKISYVLAPDSEPYKGGKRYGMVILRAGTELLGYLEIRPDGTVRITENPFFESLKMDEIKSIRWLNKVVVKLKSGEIVIGHLVREESGHILIETLIEPKNITKIPLSDIEKKEVIRSVEFGKKRYTRPKVAILAGAFYALGSFRNAFGIGPFAGLSLQQNFSRFFNRDTYWLPDIRVDATAVQFRRNGFDYQGIYVNAGPTWILNGSSEHRGIFSFALLPGIVFEKGSSPFLPEGGSAKTLSMQVVLSYEYPVFRQLHLGFDLRGLYSHDNTTPLYAAGAGLRMSYQF